MKASVRDAGVVIAGAGLMGRWHAHAVDAIGGRIVAVVDADGSRAETLARRYRARATTDLAEALESRPTAVHVCTPLASHEAVALAALNAGAHVLMEKPFAPSAFITRALLERAAERRLIACPVHQFLFQRGVQRVLRRLPEFGPIVHADFVACSAGADDMSDRKRQLALDILPHPLSLLRRLLPVRMDAWRWQATVAAPGEARLSGGNSAMTAGILISAAGRPTRNTARFIGERGTAHVDLFHGFSTFEPPAVSRAQKAIRPFRLGAATVGVAATNLATRAFSREAAYPGLRELIRAFYGAAQGTAPPPISPEETLDVAIASDQLGGLISGE